MDRRKCEICGREEGSTVDRCGVEDGIALGAIEPCETCGRWACPDCLHEADCCFVEEDEHSDEPAWSPPGWMLVQSENGWKQWHRLPT